MIWIVFILCLFNSCENIEEWEIFYLKKQKEAYFVKALDIFKEKKKIIE